MADMLTIGSIATNTFKTALNVTSNNVANVATDGYTRQRAEISSNTPGSVGTAFQGGGSKVDSVERIHADYIQTQLVSSQSLVERYDTQLQLGSQVEGIVASNDQGIQTFMQSYFDSLQNLASNPTSNTSRQLVIDEAQNLESHISNLTSVLDETQTQVNSQVSGLTVEINNRLETIKAINTQVESANNSGRQAPNELLDQRDQAIFELGQYIDIKTFPQENGRIDIHTGNGKLPLLSDNTLTKLEADLGPYKDENRQEVYMTLGGKRQVVSDSINGGQLGGVLDFRDNLLDKAQNDLGLTLNGLTASMNWQNYQGYDMSGDAGGDLFAPLETSAIHNMYNDSASGDGSGIAISFNPSQPAVGFNGEPPYNPATQPTTYGDKEEYLNNAFTAIGQMEPREYEMTFNGVSGEFDVYEKGESTLLGSFANNASTPKIIDGLEFKADGGTYTDGDSFIVKPHQDMLSQFQSVISKPDLIASRGQSPIVGTFDGGDGDFDNNGDGKVDLKDSKPGSAAVGDNVNMANMASLQSAKILLEDDSGQASETLLGGFSQMATNVGMYVRGSDIQLTAQTNVFQQLSDQRESISGVSLDEEAANLIKYQQAYEAAAQIIATSQSLFQTILGAVRG
jgi:flagellar hook-associated protein 1 FlgK